MCQFVCSPNGVLVLPDDIKKKRCLRPIRCQTAQETEEVKTLGERATVQRYMYVAHLVCSHILLFYSAILINHIFCGFTKFIVLKYHSCFYPTLPCKVLIYDIDVMNSDLYFDCGDFIVLFFHYTCEPEQWHVPCSTQRTVILISQGALVINLLNAELKPICHLLALLGAHHILHVSRIRVNS